MQKAGLRAFVGKLSMDTSTRPTYVESSTSTSISALTSSVDKCYKITERHPPYRRLVEPVITPRFVPTCTDELLSCLGALSQEKGLRVQSHLAEAHDQVKWVKEERGADDIAVFDRVGVFLGQT
jgi:guanine deaminase